MHRSSRVVVCGSRFVEFCRRFRVGNCEQRPPRHQQALVQVLPRKTTTQEVLVQEEEILVQETEKEDQEKLPQEETWILRINSQTDPDTTESTITDLDAIT